MKIILGEGGQACSVEGIVCNLIICNASGCPNILYKEERCSTTVR